MTPEKRTEGGELRSIGREKNRTESKRTYIVYRNQILKEPVVGISVTQMGFPKIENSISPSLLLLNARS